MTTTLSDAEAERKAQALAIRKQFYDDPIFYAGRALKIRTKDGRVVPLIFNAAQRQLLKIVTDQLATTGKVRVIILKARQLGLSTAVEALLYWWVSQRSAQKALVMTHHADSTRALFDMVQRYHDHCPMALKPETKYSSRRELSFPALDSAYAVATAGGEGVGRGETFTLAHLSELAFWPPSRAVENLNGIMQTIPNAPGSMIFIESTANGVTGPFYELWQGAVNGENGFVPLFIPWFTDPAYREDVPANFERTPEEEDLVKLHGLDNGQLVFRRRKIAQNGRDNFLQEYPSTPMEAFISTGMPAFNVEKLAERSMRTRPILRRMTVEGTELLENPRGELLVYHEHDPGETYYIGADVAMGVRGGDYSVAQILDSQKRQVAVWRGHVHPDYFADVLYALGTYFNVAKLTVEQDQHGLLTLYRLFKELNYENVYTSVVVDKISDVDTPVLGFKQNRVKRNMIIDELRGAMRENEIELNDKTTIKELMTFVRSKSGKLEAEEGCHDDCVMALALANHTHDGVWTPIKNESRWYVAAL